MTEGCIYVQVTALKNVSKQELLDFVAQHIARNSPNRRKLSIQVYGGQHLVEYRAAKGQALNEKSYNLKLDPAAGEGCAVPVGKSVSRAAADRIDNIYTFKRSQELHESLRGGKHAAYS